MLAVAVIGVVEIAACESATSAALTREPELTSGRSAVVGKLNFERRWKSISAIYEKAGLPQEKIEQLRDLDRKALEDLQSGKRPDFKSLQAARRKIVTVEEEAQLESARKELLRERKSGTSDENRESTGTAEGNAPPSVQ